MISEKQFIQTTNVLMVFLTLFLFSSCDGDRKKKVDIENFEFSTTDASELYFKNIRESYYNIEEKDGIKIFRFKAYDELDSVWLKPIIVHHWRVDKAFLMLEFHPDVNPENIIISDSLTENSYQVVQIKDHLKLANDLYNQLLEEKDPNILLADTKKQLFNQKLEKSNFSLVLYDFFRFTNVF